MINYKPVVIIGAGRSGTNMLRDTLTQIAGVETWPCDEINYIWRHHNVTHKTDEFTSDMATSKAKKYIRQKFDEMAEETNAKYLVEKTCANSLRVEFVQNVVPEAKYLHIVRDGRDVVESAKKRWEAPLDTEYIGEKMRFVPKSDLPYYGFKYFLNRLYKITSRENRLASWGPQFTGMTEQLKKVSLEEVCAYQWKASVEKATNAFKNFIPSSQYHTIYYEDFVEHPVKNMKQICAFLNIEITPEEIERLTQDVSSKSVGKGVKTLSDKNLLERVNTILNPAMERHQYEM
ncbi:sulfotransferase [Salibacterium salarium]|uniref:Sulfotransferase n=1 Tax=Salibacterium salarium TaxID=284579 RepID=A0A428N0J0_9BACI|nr:sulfotransferase [Salibacterium salarium]RSL31857.1 sulfotransferase [Salibacterium salarium]